MENNIQDIINKYRNRSDFLIELLTEIQKLYGYLPRKILYQISNELNTPISIIMGVVTFYSYFTMVPKGKYTIRVCNGTACHVKGSGEILQTIKNKLKINNGETTKDLKFSLETVSCLGACALAPVMMVNDKYYGKLDIGKVGEIIDSFN